jgi:hypothetical protein
MSNSAVVSSSKCFGDGVVALAESWRWLLGPSLHAFRDLRTNLFVKALELENIDLSKAESEKTNSWSVCSP